MAIIFRSRREWRIERLGRIYSVDFVQEGTRFEGRYLGIDNSSVFKGEVLTGRGAILVHFSQTTPGNGYCAVHAGKLVRSDRIEGHWYDTAGNSGKFTLTSAFELSGAIEVAKERAIASHVTGEQQLHPNPPPLLAGVIKVED